MNLTISLAGDKKLCHMGVRCVRKCDAVLNHAVEGFSFSWGEYEQICHEGECWPK